MSDEKDSLTIGKKLHDARVAKGYTLDDLQKNTKIQKRYLIAIEDNDFDSLPGEFYVRAFVKQYADSVGLDGSELLSQFDTKLPDTEDPEYVDRVNDDNPETRSAQRKVEARNDKLRRYIPIISVSVVVLIILIAIWVAAARSTRNTAKTQIETSKVSVSGNKSTSSKSSSTKKPKTTKKSSGVTFKKVTASGSNITYQVTGTSGKVPLKIAATGTASAWTSVSADGTSLWQASLTSGKSHTISLPSSTSTVTINAGNAEATQITVDGKKLKLAAPLNSGSTQVRVITLQFGKSSSSASSSSSSSATTSSSTTTTGTTGTTGTSSTTGTNSGTTGTTSGTGTTGTSTDNSNTGTANSY